MKTITGKFRLHVSFLWVLSFVLFSFSSVAAQTANDTVVDFDGDGKTDIGYFMVGATNEETGFWHLASTSGAANFYRFGARPSGGAGAGDIPVAGYNNR